LSFITNCVETREAVAYSYKTINYCSFKNFNEHGMNAINFDITEIIAEPNSSIDVLYHMMEALLNKHAPVKIKL
jgi:hypothetical protein